MFWLKKKPKEKITDPVTDYARLLHRNKAGSDDGKKVGLLKKLLRPGSDSDFVYYED
jgi:hypothetical protein